MEVIPIFHKSVASDLPIPGITVSSLIVCSLVIASDELHDEVTFVVNLPKKIVGYFEHIAIQILEITAVTAPKHLLCRLHNGCSKPFGFLHHGIDLFLRCGVIADCHARKGGTHSQDKRAGEAGRQAPNERNVIFYLWQLRTRQGRETHRRLGAGSRTATVSFGKGEERNPKGSRSLAGHNQGKGQSYCRIERNLASLRGRAELDKTFLQWLLPAFEYPSDASKDEFL